VLVIASCAERRGCYIPRLLLLRALDFSHFVPYISTVEQPTFAVVPTEHSLFQLLSLTSLYLIPFYLDFFVIIAELQFAPANLYFTYTVYSCIKILDEMSGIAASASATPSATPSAALPTSTSSIKLTGTTSTTKPTGTPAQKDLEHKAEALLAAGVIKKLAVLHQQQLLKGSASKVPAEALESIRQLNEMLDGFTIEEETTVKVCSLLT
jgi:hypothetical protein